MPKRRILGNTGDVIESPVEKIICPICNISIESLDLLNKHIDKFHLQEDVIHDVLITESNSLPAVHYRKFRNGLKCNDPRCNLKLRNGGFRNCSCCGEIFCSRHCNLNIKLTNTLKVDPNGTPVKCCLACLNKNLNDELITHDRSKEFKKLRKINNEAHELNKLVVDRRLFKFLNSIKYDISEQELKTLEESLVDWKDHSNCVVCEFKFNWFVRKHHCRLCGETVCDRSVSKCSMNVPLNLLGELINGSQVCKEDSFGIRICSNCKNDVLTKHVFEKDLKKDLEFLKYYKMWKILETKLNSYNLRDISNNENKILELFNRLDKLIKKIEQEVKSEQLVYDEIVMLKNLKMVIIKYIQKKLPIFRKSQQDKLENERKILQQMITNTPSLSMNEIKSKREKLIVLNEQKFLVENMKQDLKNKRQFDNLQTLDENLLDINEEIDKITKELGNQSFTT